MLSFRLFGNYNLATISDCVAEVRVFVNGSTASLVLTSLQFLYSMFTVYNIFQAL